MAFSQSTPYLLVGTYTSGKSEGIYVYNFDSKTADTKLVSTVKSSNPSFLAVSPDQKTVYAVNENADTVGSNIGGGVSAFSFDKKSGKLTMINQRFSGGKHPCYVTVDKSGKWVLAGNYNSGSIAIFSVSKNGGLGTITQLKKHKGSGPNKDRQEAPHVHQTLLSADNKFLFTPDLGLDKVFQYQFNAVKGKIKPAAVPFVKSEPGSGPRHLAFDPTNSYAYLNEELTGTVVAYKYSNGSLTNIQRISGLQPDFKGFISGADIHVSPNGKFVYSSNRGESNSISIFSIDKKTGLLTLIGEQSVLGKTPRNFNFDPTGNFLLAANQESDNIVIFSVNQETGLLTDTGKRIEVPNPVCVKWITK